MSFLFQSTSDMVTPITIQAEYQIVEMSCSNVNPVLKQFDGNDPTNPDLILEQKVRNYLSLEQTRKNYPIPEQSKK